MKLLSKYVNQESLKLFYNAYILPLFDYGCVVWGHCSANNRQRLLKLQKRTARLILKAELTTPSKQMFDSLQWIPFPKRIAYHTCIMIYKSLNNQSPEYINSLLSKLSETNVRPLRSSSYDLLHIPRSHSVYYDHAFSVYGPTVWNKLPLVIRSANSLCSFKKQLKSYLLSDSSIAFS